MGMGKKTQLTAIAAGVAATLAAIAAVSIKPDIRKTTRRYAQKDGTNLYLDRYETERRVHHRRPVIIFTYGGGFHKGRRDNREYIDFFHFLARKGYVVAAIDYRKGLRDLPAEKRKSTLAFLGALNDAIYMAVDDLVDATAYIIAHADEWGIDTNNIILCGSSAGAITALQTEYAICNSQPEVTGKLPKDFNYAGVMSFAGALSDKQLPEWEKKPCPIMLFHGDADRRVPFRRAAINGVGGLWGSTTIAETLKARKSPYYIYVIDNASHEVCKTPMAQHRRAITEFLHKLVHRHKQLRISIENHRSKLTGVKKDFKLKEYIINNM